MRLTRPNPKPLIPTPKTKAIKKSNVTATPQLLKNSVIQDPIKMNFNIVSTVTRLKS